MSRKTRVRAEVPVALGSTLSPASTHSHMYSVSIVSHTLARSHWEPQHANEKQAFRGKEAEQVGLTTGTTEEGASLRQLVFYEQSRRLRGRNQVRSSHHVS